MFKEAIERIDHQLLLFRAIKKGLQAKVIDSILLQKIEQEAVAMIVKLAERYWSTTYEAYIRQAAYCLLGITNLGLLYKSGGSIEKAVELIRTFRMIGLFRSGWGLIEKLIQDIIDAQKQSDFIEWVQPKYRHTPIRNTLEKEIIEEFAFEPGQIWNNQRYQQLIEKYHPAAEKNRFRLWMVENYLVPNKDYEVAQIQDLTGAEIDTLFVSLLLDHTPHIPLSLRKCMELASKFSISRPSAKATLKKRLQKFCVSVPQRWKEICQQEATSFLEHTLPKIIQGIESNKTKHQTLEYLLDTFKVHFTPDDLYGILEQEIEAEIKPYSRRQLRQLLKQENIVSTQYDPLYRLAILKRFLQKGIREAEDLIAILEEIPQEAWRGRILWEKVPWGIIDEALMSEEIRSANRIVLLKELVAALPGAIGKKWRNISLISAINLFLAASPEQRKWLIGRAHIEDAVEALWAEEKLIHQGYLIVVDAAGILLVADEMESKYSMESIISRMLERGVRSLNWSEDDIYDYVTRLIAKIKGKLTLYKKRHNRQILIRFCIDIFSAASMFIRSENKLNRISQKINTLLESIQTEKGGN